MAGNTRYLQKQVVFVDVALSDGSLLSGKLFISSQARVIDTLNDERIFIPFETMDGTTYALAKADIRSVKLPAMAPPVYRGSDPYLIIGVSQTATAEQVKDTYRKLCFSNHPDRVRGLGLGADFVELATQNMMRINSAYSQILRTLKMAEAAASDEPKERHHADHGQAGRRKAS